MGWRTRCMFVPRQSISMMHSLREPTHTSHTRFQPCGCGCGRRSCRCCPCAALAPPVPLPSPPAHSSSHQCLADPVQTHKACRPCGGGGNLLTQASTDLAAGRGVRSAVNTPQYGAAPPSSAKLDFQVSSKASNRNIPIPVTEIVEGREWEFPVQAPVCRLNVPARSESAKRGVTGLSGRAILVIRECCVVLCYVTAHTLPD